MIDKDKIEHVFFDLDHTLWDFDTNAGICLNEIFQESNFLGFNNIPKEKFVLHFNKINQRLWNRLEKNEISHEYLRIHRFRLVFESFDIIISDSDSYDLNKLFLEKLPSQSALLPFAVEILEYLKAKYSLHILSNGFHQVQVKKMTSAGILNYFDKIITNELAQFLKPDPRVFEFAFQHAGTSKFNTIMIGDNYQADIEGAMSAGIPFLHLTNASENLDYKNQGHKITCLSEIKKHL